MEHLIHFLKVLFAFVLIVGLALMGLTYVGGAV
jgi:hypothetical protein